MLNNTDIKKYLNALVNQGSENGVTTNVIFSVDTTLAQLALFTKMPDHEMQGAVEVTLPGYARKPLYGLGISGKMQFSNPAAWSEEDGMYAISNTDEIQMHAINEDAEGQEEVVGFGIYCGSGSQKVLKAAGKLMDWDEGQNKWVEKSVTLKAGSVPIFYIGKFKLLML